MIAKQLVLAGCAAIVLSIATAQAGPCNTVGKSAQDAGAGPTSGYSGQTIGTGSANTGQHPPTDAMNRATGDVASSSQDAQRQMQGQPTAAQPMKGVVPRAGREQEAAACPDPAAKRSGGVLRGRHNNVDRHGVFLSDCRALKARRSSLSDLWD